MDPKRSCDLAKWSKAKVLRDLNPVFFVVFFKKIGTEFETPAFKTLAAGPTVAFHELVVRVE